MNFSIKEFSSIERRIERRIDERRVTRKKLLKYCVHELWFNFET